MKKFATFDIDGTLIRWQLYHVIVDRLAKNGQLGAEAVGQLKEARMHWKNREHIDAFSEYEAVLISLFEQALPKIEAEQFDTLVSGVIEEYKGQVYRYTRDLIKELKQKDYFLLAISGSHHELVEKVARHYGFNDWVGTKYERAKTGFSGKKYVPSLDKKKALTTLIKKHGLQLAGSLAIGDSDSDAPMLEMAEQPIAFNPDRKLFETAKQRGWKVVLERKNMIYQLEKQGATYVLVI